MFTFGSWEAIASAPVEHIAYAIRVGGLSKVKAVRIKEILNQIKRERDCISLDFLNSMNASEAKEYLMRLPGVGEKTANCVLLFSLGKPCLPVDTHVFRVAKRLGLIDARTSIKEAHRLLQQQVPPSGVYQFHIHMIEHGRKICHARNPECGRCILRNDCPSSSAHQR
jgi:endonuclease-3